MIRVSTLQEAIQHLEDGDRVILSLDGKDIGIVFADEAELLEEWDDRADVEAYRRAKPEPGDDITLEEYVRRRAARKARRTKVAG